VGDSLSLIRPARPADSATATAAAAATSSSNASTGSSKDAAPGPAAAPGTAAAVQGRLLTSPPFEGDILTESSGLDSAGDTTSSTANATDTLGATMQREVPVAAADKQQLCNGMVSKLVQASAGTDSAEDYSTQAAHSFSSLTVVLMGANPTTVEAAAATIRASLAAVCCQPDTNISQTTSSTKSDAQQVLLTRQTAAAVCQSPSSTSSPSRAQGLVNGWG